MPECYLICLICHQHYLIGFNNLEVSSDITKTGDFALATHVTEILTDVFNAGIYNIDDLSTRVFNDFNHDIRKWTQKIYTNKQMVKLLSTAADNNSENAFSELKNNLFYSYELLNKNYPNFTHYEIYDIFKRLEIRNE